MSEWQISSKQRVNLVSILDDVSFPLYCTILCLTYICWLFVLQALESTVGTWVATVLYSLFACPWFSKSLTIVSISLKVALLPFSLCRKIVSMGVSRCSSCSDWTYWRWRTWLLNWQHMFRSKFRPWWWTYWIISVEFYLPNKSAETWMKVENWVKLIWRSLSYLTAY